MSYFFLNNWLGKGRFSLRSNSQTYQGQAVPVVRTGFVSGLPEWGSVPYPESDVSVLTSIQLTDGGAEYADERGVTATLTGTVGETLSLIGFCGSIDIVVSGTLANATIELTNGLHTETRTAVLSSGSAVNQLSGYFVDSVNGSDSSDGLSIPTALKTIAGLKTKIGNTWNYTGIINLARGSRWRESIGGMDSGLIGIVRGVGVGPLPILDAFDVVDAGNWSLAGGATNRYVTTFFPDDVSDVEGFGAFTVKENGIPLKYVANIAACEATPGSYYAPLTSIGVPSYEISIHPRGSTNPTSDGKTYEVVSRDCGVRMTGESIIDSVYGRGSISASGTLIIGSNTHQGNPLIIRSVMTDGTSHNSYMYQGSYRHCAFIGMQLGGRTSNSMLVFNRNDASTDYDLVVDDCAFIQWPQSAGDICAPIYGHPNTSGKWNSCTISNCGFAYMHGNATVSGYTDGELGVDLLVIEDCVFEKGTGSVAVLCNSPTIVRRNRFYSHLPNRTVSGNPTSLFTGRQSVVTGWGEGVEIYDNVFTAKLASNPLIYGQANTAFYAHHNVFARVNSAGSVLLVGDVLAAVTADLRNNIFADASNAINLSTVGSSLAPTTDYNVFTPATIDVRESSAAVSRDASVYISEASTDQNSVTTTPTWESNTLTGIRPMLRETSASALARGFGAGPQWGNIEDATTTDWDLPPTYAAWLRAVESLSAATPVVTISDPGVVGNGITFDLTGTVALADGGFEVESVVLTWSGGSAVATVTSSYTTTATWSASVTLTGTSEITITATAVTRAGVVGTDTQAVTPVDVTDYVTVMRAIGGTGIYLCGDGSSTYGTEDVGNAEAGTQWESWLDKRTSGGTNATQTTDSKQPTLVLDSADYRLDFAAGDSMVLASSIISGLSGMLLTTAVNITTTAGTQDILSASAVTIVKIVSGKLRVYTTASTYGECDITTGRHVITWAFNGGATGNDNRSRVWIDYVEQDLVFTGTVPTTTGASTTTRLARNSADTSNQFLGGFYGLTITNTAPSGSVIAVVDQTWRNYLGWY